MVEPDDRFGRGVEEYSKDLIDRLFIDCAGPSLLLAVRQTNG